MRIVWLPLEPFPLRYTEQWYSWFPREFNRWGVNYIQVNGQPLTSGIELGSVLDAYGTTYYKMQQISKLIALMRLGKVTSNDVLLFADLWYPGIEALKYISCLGGQRPKIVGILHAGTYDSNDFTYRTGMRPWGHLLEAAWLGIFDRIFVATGYHKRLILRNHQVNHDKIVVTGLPFYPDELQKYATKEKEDIVVFPHRLDPEKQPGEFDAMAKLVGLPKVKWLKSFDICHTKEDYYQLLGKARVAISLALQETFGYAMLEATALGCLPLVPNRLSYPELYSETFVYQNTEDLIRKLRQYLSFPSDYERTRSQTLQYHQDYLTKSIERMLNALNEGFD